MKKIDGLKKIESGSYEYKGRYHIYCGGYDRICGHVRWYASVREGDDIRAVTEADTLSQVVRQIDQIDKLEKER